MLAACSTSVSTYVPLALKWSVELNLVARNEAPHIPLAVGDQGVGGDLLHPDADRPGVVLLDFPEIGGLIAAALVDAVVALGIAAGEFVDLPLIVAADLESDG